MTTKSDKKKTPKVGGLRVKSVAPGKAKQVTDGPSGQPWRGSSLGPTLDKVGE